MKCNYSLIICSGFIMHSDSRGQFKLERQNEFERHAQKKQEIEMDQRERLAELRRKRNSIATDRVPFTSLTFGENVTGHYSDGDSIASREVRIRILVYLS